MGRVIRKTGHNEDVIDEFDDSADLDQLVVRYQEQYPDADIELAPDPLYPETSALWISANGAAGVNAVEAAASPGNRGGRRNEHQSASQSAGKGNREIEQSARSSGSGIEKEDFLLKGIVPAAILAAGLMGFAVISSWGDLTQTENVVPLEAGNVKLGEVFFETAGQSVRIENSEDGSVLASVRTNEFDIEEKLREELQDGVDLYNQDRSEGEQGTLDTLMFQVPIVVEYRGWVDYESEHHRNFDLTVARERVAFAASDAAFSDFVDLARRFQSQNRPRIETSFLLR